MTTLSFADARHEVRKPLLRFTGLTLLGLMIPAATFSRHVFGELGSLVLAFLLLCGALAVLARAALVHSLPRQVLRTLAASLPILAIYAVSTAIHYEATAVTNLAQLVLVLGFMAGLTFIKWDKSDLRPLFWIFAALLVMHVAWWLAAGAPRIFHGFMGHPNGLGLFAFLLAFVPVLIVKLSRRHSLIKHVALAAVVGSAVLLYATSSRANWLAAVVAAFAFILWRALIARRRWLFHLTFALALSASIGLTWLYMIAPNYAWGWQVHELTVEYTGKNLFSGRHLFWQDLASAIAQRPWFGYGAGAVAESFTGYAWSAHNLYMQTALQVGVVGLAALVALLWFIWSQLWRGRDTVFVQLAAAYFLGVLVHQTFEVSLTQNNLANGFLIWLILAVGLSHSLRHSR